MNNNIIHTPSQVEAIAKYEAFLPSEEMIFDLAGGAGQGKTTITREFVKRTPKGTCIGVSPTHKACQNFREHLDGLGVEVVTLDSFLGLQPKREGRGSIKVRSKHYDPSKFLKVDTVFLDEKSMADQYHVEFMLEDIRTMNRKWVKIGDECQLPPVNEPFSLLDTMELPDSCKARLRETHRFGGAILELATSVRNVIEGKTKTFELETNVEDGKGVFVLDREEWGKKVKECIRDDRFKSEPNFFKILAHSNTTVLEYENRVDRQLGLTPDNPFPIGSMAVANEAFSRDNQMVLGTCEDVKVLSCRKETHPVYPSLQGWVMDLQKMDSTVVTVTALDHYSSRESYKAILNQLAKDADAGDGWYKYYGLRDYYADIRKGTALTIHKMQGSGAVNIAFDYSDVYKDCRSKTFDWKFADRLVYTALTRARVNLFILAREQSWK